MITRSARVFLLVACLVAMLNLGFILWSLRFSIQRPDAGATWSYNNGRVLQIDPDGPAAGRLQVGDRILAVDGLSIREARGFPGRNVGDELNLEVLRGGSSLPVVLRLARPGLLIQMDRITPLLLALAFWVVGSLAALRDRSRNRWWMFLFGQTACACLATGALSASGPQWTIWAFGFLLWWAGPLTVHVHLWLFRRTPTAVLDRLLPGLYGVAALLALAGTYGRIREVSTAAIQAVEYAWLGLNFALVVVVVASGYLGRSRNRVAANRMGILALLALVGILPLLVLSLLPEALFGYTLLPYELSFIALLLIPTGYGLALFNDEFSGKMRFLGHTFGYIICLFILVAAYLGIYYSFLVIFQMTDRAQLLSGMVVALAIVAYSRSLYRLATHLVDTFVLGESYDFQAAIQETERSLRETNSTPQSTADQFCRSLTRIMGVEYAGILDRNGDLRVCPAASGDSVLIQTLPEGELQAILGADGDPLTREEIQARINQASSKPGARLDQLRKWVGGAEILLPLRGSHGALALLFLGRRARLRGYTPADWGILESIVGQGSIAIENAYLLAETRLHASQIARLHHQVIQAREDERKRVSHDLHDQVIQSLVGVNFQISDLRGRVPVEERMPYDELQGAIKGLSSDLRQICAELRPPALDTVGLMATLESRAAELNRQEMFQVNFQSPSGESAEIPDEAAICLFRVFQEAVNNIQKHSGATRVDVSLEVLPAEVSLTVSDNGKGFDLPARMDELIGGYHFGLVGMRERLSALGGSLSIQTGPGKGCQVTAVVPQLESRLQPEPGQI